MRKEEFFDKLEYLLQDIPDQDREDALAYYRDYLAEAGSGNEEAAIEDFGSPERVAAIIRADLAGNLNDGGSFTDRGYEDERFRDPGYQVAKRLDLPEERENTAGSGSGRGYEKDGWQTGPSQRGSGYQDPSYEAVRFSDLWDHCWGVLPDSCGVYHRRMPAGGRDRFSGGVASGQRTDVRDRHCRDRCGTSGSGALIRHSGHVPPIFMEKHEKGGSMDFT